MMKNYYRHALKMWENAEKVFSSSPHQLDINSCDISKTGVVATCSSDR